MTKFIGINDKIPQNSINYKYFNIISYLNKLDIQPDIQSVKQVNACVDIIGYKVVNPTINSFTLIIYGNLYIKLIYIPIDIRESLYTIYHNQYFMDFVDIPENIAKSNSVEINPYIIEININECILDKGSIAVNTKILVDVKGCSCKRLNAPCNKIDYIGISNTHLKDSIYYNYLIIDDNLLIPNDKPSIEDIISIESNVEIIYYTITPIYEDEILIKYDLLMNLKVNDTILYIGNLPIQPVHACSYTTCILNASMDLPSNLEVDSISVNPYIKDILAISTYDRTISRHIALVISIEK